MLYLKSRLKLRQNKVVCTKCVIFSCVSKANKNKCYVGNIVGEKPYRRFQSTVTG